MAPNAEDCETARLNVEESAVNIHHGRKILPDGQAPTTAWTENEEERQDNINSPGENKRLLPSSPTDKHHSKLQAGLTLGVYPPGKNAKYPQVTKNKKVLTKPKLDKKKDKIITLLKPPYFTIIMIILLVGVHNLLPTEIRGLLEWSPGAWWRQPWRLVTYAFLHATKGHLALNALVAIVVGWALEREQSWWRVLIIWCGGAAAGALGAGAYQPHVNVVGASAAVFAVLTAHVANVFFRFRHIPLWWFRPLSVVVLCTSELCYALSQESTCSSHSMTAHAQGDCTAWAAHLFGCAVGVPLSFLVFTGEHNRKPLLIACRVVSGAILIAGLITTIIFYVYYGE